MGSFLPDQQGASGNALSKDKLNGSGLIMEAPETKLASVVSKT